MSDATRTLKAAITSAEAARDYLELSLEINHLDVADELCDIKGVLRRLNRRLDLLSESDFYEVPNDDRFDYLCDQQYAALVEERTLDGGR